MQNMQMYTQQPMTGMAGARPTNAAQDWSGEISTGQEWNDSWQTMPARFQGNGQMSAPGGLQMSNRLPAEVVESPTSTQEAYLGSLKAMLMRNKGNYIVATFLVGTQNTVSWEGILYDVGNDYVTIYQEGRDRYIVSDMYSLRYMEFYDTRRRELCDRFLAGQNWSGNGNM
jgi:hypothetical protein